MDLHGGNIYKVFREKNIKEILDYSSNINPFGVPESLINAITENMRALEKYPDPEYYELRKIFADYNHVDFDNILAGNGATELIFLYMKAVKPKKVLILSPTFAEYERSIKSAVSDCEITYFELKKENDFLVDIENLKKKLSEKYDILVMCNPNNPTGKFTSKEKMKEILLECNKYETKFFVDEAFIEFVTGGINSSIISEDMNKVNLFVIRALTKFFAIPGLRLGYAVFFDEKLKEKFNSLKEPWSINAFAEIAGKILFHDREYIEKTEKWIEKEKKYMYHELNKIKNLEVYETDTNFILLKALKLDAGIIQEEMLKKGILIRNASNFRYLNESFIRLAVKDRKNNEIVIKSINEVINNGDN